MKRSGLVLVVALLAGVAVFGAAASLGVTSKKVDSFGANQAATTSSTSGDTTPPTVGATDFYDSNLNGKIDQIKLTYSEPLAATTATAPWSITGGPSGLVTGDLAQVSVSSNVVTLSFSETAGTATSLATAAPSLQVSLDNTSGVIKDLATPANLAASFAGRPVSDKAAPTLVSLQMFDTGATPNGKVDELIATFSEALQATSSHAGWTLANTPSAGSLGGVSVTSTATTATVTVTEGASAADTAVGLFTVALDATTSQVKDPSGNPASFPATAPTDKARPIPVAVVIANGGATTGQPEKGDTVTITWSERLNEATICAGFDDVDTVTITGNSGDAQVRIKNHTTAPATTHDVLDVNFKCGLQFGTISLGSNGYVTADKTFAGNPDADRSSATWNPSARTFQLKLGATAAGGVAAVSSSVAVYDPHDSLADPAGNTVPSTTVPPTLFVHSTANTSQF
jgi:hypothetical protein